MEFPNISFLDPDFYRYCEQATIRKWTEGKMIEMILKVAEGHLKKVDTYHSHGL